MGLLRVNVHMCAAREIQNKWIKKKRVSEEGLLKPCVWGSAMQPWVPGRRDGRVILQRWLGVSIRERSDKELRLEEQRCVGGGRPGKLWSWGCGNKVLHPQLFYSAIY